MVATVMNRANSFLQGQIDNFNSEISFLQTEETKINAAFDRMIEATQPINASAGPEEVIVIGYEDFDEDVV